ncbi:MAG TPA: hypothetical protein VH538_12735 [Gaiellaceae bacterium]
MKRHRFDLVVLAVLATVATAYAALSHPGVRSISLHVYALALGGLVMLAIVLWADDAVARRSRSRFDASLVEVEPAAKRLPDLERVEREVTLAAASSYDLHFRLLPHLREIAQARLERAGKTPSAATLGGWWELLRPDRPVPDDRFAPGISEADLRALVADLEALGRSD